MILILLFCLVNSETTSVPTFMTVYINNYMNKYTLKKRKPQRFTNQFNILKLRDNLKSRFLGDMPTNTDDHKMWRLYNNRQILSKM